MINGKSYTITEPCKIIGKPFHGGGVTEVTLLPRNKPGIIFSINDQEFELKPEGIEATSKYTARFNKAIFVNLQHKKEVIEVIEHRHSAIVQTLGFQAGIIISLPKINVLKELSESLLGGTLAYLIRQKLKRNMMPYAGGGIAKPHDIIQKHKTIEPIHNGRMLMRKDIPKKSTTIGDVDIEANKDFITLTDTHSGARIEICASESLECTVLDAIHPDVRQLNQIENILPYHTNYKHNDTERLGARALGKLGKIHQHIGKKIVTATGGYAISEEGYFLAYGNTSPNDLVGSMKPYFQKTKNEHLAHTAEADFPSELRIPIQLLSTDNNKISGFNLHFKLSQTNHISRVKLLKAFAHYTSANIKL